MASFRIHGSRSLLLVGAGACAGMMSACEPAWQPGPVGAIEEPIRVADVPPFDDMVMPQALPPDQAEAAERFAASGAPTVLYLNFSDGTTVLKSGAVDYAPGNISSICSTTAKGYPLWDGTDDDIKAWVGWYMAITTDYNLVVTTKRPVNPPYTMVMLAPLGNGCQLGGLGIANLDCGNKNPNDIVFDYGGYAVTFAQEAGHAFGLEHDDVGCDVMGVSYTDKTCVKKADTDRRYTDQDGAVLGGLRCGPSTQNSHKLMLANLGAWPGGDKPDPYSGAVGSGGSGGSGSGGSGSGGSGSGGSGSGGSGSGGSGSGGSGNGGSGNGGSGNGGSGSGGSGSGGSGAGGSGGGGSGTGGTHGGGNATGGCSVSRGHGSSGASAALSLLALVALRRRRRSA